MLVSVHVSVCAGGVKVTLNGSAYVRITSVYVCVCVFADTFGACAMALIVCIHLHLQRRHKQAVQHATDSVTKLSLIWIHVHVQSKFSPLVKPAIHP